MSKYRLKRKTNQPFVITIVVISLLISVSIGYSLWSDTIFIHVNSSLRYVEPKLENIEFILDQDGDYVSREEDMNWGLGSKVTEYQGSTLVETVDSNTNRLDLAVTYKLKKSMVGDDRTVITTFHFKNNNKVPFTNGTYELIEKSLDYTPTIYMPETVPVDGTADFEIDFDILAYKTIKTGKYVIKYKYQVGEVTRYMYFTLTLLSS